MRTLHRSGGRTQTEVQKLAEARAKFPETVITYEVQLPTDWDAQNVPTNGTPVFLIPPELAMYIHC